MFKIGQKVLIGTNAFPDSDEENDVAARGKIGVIVRVLAHEIPDFKGCYAVEIDSIFDEILVIDDELTLVEDTA
jgi:hypothetical protein